MECKSSGLQQLTTMQKNVFGATYTCISLLAYLSEIFIMLFTSQVGILV